MSHQGLNEEQRAELAREEEKVSLAKQRKEDRYRHALDLKYARGLSEKQVAEELGLKSARSLLTRARKWYAEQQLEDPTDAMGEEMQELLRLREILRGAINGGDINAIRIAIEIGEKRLKYAGAFRPDAAEPGIEWVTSLPPGSNLSLTIGGESEAGDIVDQEEIVEEAEFEIALPEEEDV